jgi:hypothetical protein
MLHLRSNVYGIALEHFQQVLEKSARYMPVSAGCKHIARAAVKSAPPEAAFYRAFSGGKSAPPPDVPLYSARCGANGYCDCSQFKIIQTIQIKHKIYLKIRNILKVRRYEIHFI